MSELSADMAKPRRQVRRTDMLRAGDADKEEEERGVERRQTTMEKKSAHRRRHWSSGKCERLAADAKQ